MADCCASTLVLLPCPQSITALAHLRAACIYMVDISEQCGYTIAQQAALFHSIKPLFSNKPILIVCNKVRLPGGGQCAGVGAVTLAYAA